MEQMFKNEIKAMKLNESYEIKLYEIKARKQATT